MFKLEQDLIDEFKEGVNSIFNIKNLAEEIPFFSRNIDMVILNNKDELISIEFKLHDMKSVLAQASKCLLCSDLVYVCLPKKNFRKTTLEQFRKAGIGVLLVDDKITILEKAQYSKKSFLKDKIRNYL
jgi:hypothetical protein